MTANALANEYDLDSETFSAEQYVEKLTRNSLFTELLENTQNISSEMRSLRTELQMHIYGNYSQFIEAADKIRDMKEGVEKLEHSSDELTENIKVISEKSDSINANLSTGRKKIEELSGVRKFLARLKFLFSIPSKIHAAIDLNDYGEAMKLYEQTREVMERYQAKPAVMAAQAETMKAIGRLKTRLHRRVDDNSSTMMEISECVKYLIRLGADRGDMMNTFLTTSRMKLERSLKSFEKEKRSRGGNGSGAVEVLGRLADGFLPDFLDFITTFRLHFCKEPVTRSSAHSSNEEVELEAAEEDAEFDPKQKLTECSRFLFSSFLNLARESLQLPISDLHGLIQGLERWLSGVRRVDALLPEARLVDYANTLVDQTIRAKIAETLQQAHSAIELTVRAFASIVISGGLPLAAEATTRDALVGFLEDRECRFSESEKSAILSFSIDAASGGYAGKPSVESSPFAPVARAVAQSIVDCLGSALSRALFLCRGRSKFLVSKRESYKDAVHNGFEKGTENIGWSLQIASGALEGAASSPQADEDQSMALSEDERQQLFACPSVLLLLHTLGSTVAAQLSETCAVYREDLSSGSVMEADRRLAWLFPWSEELYGNSLPLQDVEARAKSIEAVSSEFLRVYCHRQSLVVADKLRSLFARRSWFSSEGKELKIQPSILEIEKRLLLVCRDCAYALHSTELPSSLIGANMSEFNDDDFIVSVLTCFLDVGLTKSVQNGVRDHLRRDLDHDDFRLSTGLEGMFQAKASAFDDDTLPPKSPAAMVEKIVSFLTVSLRENCRRVFFSPEGAEAMEVDILVLYYFLKPFVVNLSKFRGLIDKAGSQLFDRCSAEPHRVDAHDIMRILDIERGNWV